jgi:lanthionine synthetase-like protein
VIVTGYPGAVPAALFHAPSHEPLGGGEWSEAAARAAVAAIAADAEEAFDPRTLWPAHPLDEEEGELPSPVGLYLGAAGVIWALDVLAEAGLTTPARDWADVAAGLPDRYLARPDLPELTGGRPVPSLLVGESGILLVAHRLAPAPEHVERMLACVRANAHNPTRELLWGSPGTALAAQLMLERTGDERLAKAWRESADWLWDEWDDGLWLQDMYGKMRRYVGAGHGFASNVHVLARGDLLDAGRRRELVRRSLETLRAYIVRDGDLAQWRPTEDPVGPDVMTRTQWCHGAPGIVTSFGPIAPDDDELTGMLAAGGELTWAAGPLAKGPGLCHGTSGNGYAFLKLFERTADERWLARARAFAMHAAAQVEHARAEHGRGRYSLWTGDVGAACFLASCLDADPAMPVLDRI